MIWMNEDDEEYSNYLEQSKNSTKVLKFPQHINSENILNFYIIKHKIAYSKIVEFNKL